MRSYTFDAEPGDPKTRMFAWRWDGKLEDHLFTARSLTDKQIDHCFEYECDGSVCLTVWILGDWVAIPYRHYLVLDYDGDLFVMSPEKFDEWFPPTEYGHGLEITDGN